ncbi:MAG: enoyl-CoA hydratase-related protein [Promethearchaeota archaeon]|jgi:crotonobetainyl-CoA hydratase
MKMDYKFIIVEKKEHITIVRLNRPEVRNAINPYVSIELEDVFNEFENDPNAWVAIVTGVGDKAFSAGFDLKWGATASREEQIEAFSKLKYRAVTGGLTFNPNITKPVIAAVNGFAMGGGFELALGCDLIIAAEHAVFSLPEPLVGRVPTEGGVHRLSRQIPFHMAMEILFTYKRISAQEGIKYGFVNKVVPLDQLMEEAEKMANIIMEGSPLAVRAIKQMANDGLETTLRKANATIFPLYRKFSQSQDFIEGPRAFSEKRKPKWKGV